MTGELPVMPSSLVPITRGIMRQRYRTLASRSLSVPRPDDEAHGIISAPTGHRVLVVGNEYAISWGVRTHALALPGQLARELALRTGLGAEVDVITDPGMSITDVLGALDEHDLGSYDTVMVLTGVGDAYQLVPSRQWARSVQQLLDTLTASTPDSTQITLVGIQPVSSVNIFKTKEHGVTDRWAQSLNEVTESLCRKSDRAHYLKAPPSLMDDLDEVDAMRFKSPTVYKAWATNLARHLVPLLAAPQAESLSGEPLVGPLEVRRRLSALRDLGILNSRPEARFTAIVRRARDLFGTEGAAFSLVTDEHQWNKAMVGYARTEVPIEESFCATTIKTAGPFVVEDAWSDPRITFDTVIRFYAGYPVHAPDGTRIGALCIFDANPRDASTIDTGYLQELARDITDQLALAPDRPQSPTEPLNPAA